MKAKCARFYSWSDTEMMNMDIHTFYKYWLAITPIEAQEQLLSLRTSSFPYLKKSDSRKYYETVSSAAKKFIKKPNEGNLATFGSVLSKIKSALGGNGG